MRQLPLWAIGPFELLVHAQGHLDLGEDFDRRIALISFDNSIEISISTYLTLNPIQRGGRTYARADVERFLANYHSKLDFLEAELERRSVAWAVDRATIVWVHDHRNEQYHGGRKGTPEKSVLNTIREAALWVFGFLFDVQDAEAILREATLEAAPPAPVASERAYDLAIDEVYGIVDVGGQSYYASEVLFAVDYDAYRDLGAQLALDPQLILDAVQGEQR